MNTPLRTRSADMIGRVIVAAVGTAGIALIALAVVGLTATAAGASDPYPTPGPDEPETWVETWQTEDAAIDCADPLGTGWVESRRFTTWEQTWQAGPSGYGEPVGDAVIVDDDTVTTLLDLAPPGAPECVAPVVVQPPAVVVFDGVAQVPAGELG